MGQSSVDVLDLNLIAVQVLYHVEDVVMVDDDRSRFFNEEELIVLIVLDDGTDRDIVVGSGQNDHVLVCFDFDTAHGRNRRTGCDGSVNGLKSFIEDVLVDTEIEITHVC